MITIHSFSSTKSLGCLRENENGLILEKILNKFSISVINDKTPTYNKFKTEFYEVLDIFLIPSSLSEVWWKNIEKVSNQDISIEYPTPIATYYFI
ncbi:hypothetical protein BpHYR1_008570 [Brachionus plicatilis]|uniref:Uncharacterized protein n=1 Tax=Brachionus plicatilis TaxID=10195 RepID=A0A3M7PWP7_BRAPC|nr:hypothetical protein BpHYR1_008570 [Brachionus plicatilis]